MKKVLLSLGLLAMAGGVSILQSCEKIKDKVKDEAGVDLAFDFDGATATFEIPVITTTGTTYNVDTVESPINLGQEISNYSNGMYTIDDLDSVTVTSVKLKINNASQTNNFANFNSAIVLFMSDSKSDETAYIGTNDVVPDTYDDEIDLVPSNTNLAPYMKGTKLYYYAGVNMRRVTTEPLNCTLTVKYRVKLK